MYHWYLLIKKHSTNFPIDYKDTLIHGHDPNSFNSISTKTYSTLFFLGLVEFAPTALGIFATGYLGKFLFPYDYVIVGVLLSILLVKLLNRKAPEVPFSLHT